MSDTPKRPSEEKDAIRQMLDRLRQTVNAPSVEEDAPAPAAPVTEPDEARPALDDLSVTDDILTDEEDTDIPDDTDSDPEPADDVAAALSEFFVLESEDEDEPAPDGADPEIPADEDFSDTAPADEEPADVDPFDEEPADEVPFGEEPVDEAPIDEVPEMPELAEAPEAPVTETVAEPEEAEAPETVDEPSDATASEDVSPAPESPRYPNAFDGEDFTVTDTLSVVEDDEPLANSEYFTLGEEEESSFAPATPEVSLAAPVTDAQTPITPVTVEEDDTSSVSTDDFLSALAWEGETDTLPPEDTGTPAEEAQAPAPPAGESEPSLLDALTDETAEAPAAADPARSLLSFFAPATPVKKTAPAPSAEAANTEITDEEALGLFAPQHPASFGSLRARYLASEEGSEPLGELPPFATEENGYAVEVAVNTPPAPDGTDAPTAVAPPAPKKPAAPTEAPVEMIDDSDFADEQDDAFLSLIGKLTPTPEAKAKKASKQQTQPAKSPFGSPVSGEQLAMEIFPMEPSSEEPAEPRETAQQTGTATPSPVVPAVSETATPPAPTEDQPLADAPDTTDTAAEPSRASADPFFGEMPTKPVSPDDAQEPAAPARRPLPVDAASDVIDGAEDEDALECELPPDESDAARRIPLPEANKPKKRQKRERAAGKPSAPFGERLRAFFGRLAPAAGEADAMNGLYTEEAAAYNEYSSRNQVAAFARKFVSEGSLCTLRIVLLAFLCTFLFALENFSLLGYHPAGPLAGRDMQVALHLFSVLLCAIASIPVFSRAWHQLFARRVTAELYPAILLILAVIYDVLLFFLAPASFVFFGLIPALAALLLAIADQRKVKADFATFRLLSSSGDKLACTVSATGKTDAERVAVADLPEGEESRIVSMKKVGTATGFFHRIVRNCEDSYQNTFLLAAGALVSLGVAIALGILTSSFLVAFYAFALTLSLLLPAVLPLVHRIPAAILSLFAANNHCAVVGEVSALEYSDAAAMTFEDSHAFPAKNMRIQRIKLYNDSALDRVLYQVSSLFSTVGGPLDGVFRASTAELGISEETTLLSVDQGGLCALVDGREIRVGGGEYMLDHAVHVFYDPEDERLLAGGKISVMFAAEDGQLVAKFYVRYKMDAAFEKSVEALARRGVRTLIRTYDPNLSDELIDKISYTADFGPRILKKEISQQNDIAVPQMNSGLVTKSATPDLLRTLFACRRTVRLVRAGSIAAYALFGVGFVGSVLLAAFSLLGAIPSAFFAGYQLAVSLLYFLVSKITV